MEPSERTWEEVLDDLARVRAELDPLTQRQEELYALRDVLLLEAREGMTPPIPQRRLADAYGVQEITITAAIRRAKEKRNADAASNGQAAP